MLRDFEDARRASDAELRAVVRGGDVAERVWALWAIALRARGDIHDLVELTTGEPDPGVRRHLAVVLASHGEVDILVALARHDPAAAVRASAMRIVTRLAAAGTVPVAVVVEQLGDRAAEVREAILAELAPPLSGAALEAAIRRHLDDGPEARRRGPRDEGVGSAVKRVSDDVRREAIAAGRRLGLADLPDDATPPDPAATAPGPTGPVHALARRR